MKEIGVITGGGSGMGLEAAKLLGQKYRLILVGRTAAKLEKAIAELTAAGVQAEAFPADASDRASVDKLAAYAAAQGPVKVVLHAAGVSPHMTDGAKIFAINALGTINIDQAFAQVMTSGCIINVASMSAYMLPPEQTPTQLYRLSLKDLAAFQNAMEQVIAASPAQQQAGTAYTLSKNFVIWYTARMAVRYGGKGLRVVSISPGTFDTPMGEIEGQEAAAFATRGALGRVGDPLEIAKMMAFIASDDCSYLTGVDILYDGGSIAALKAMQEDAPQA